MAKGIAVEGAAVDVDDLPAVSPGTDSPRRVLLTHRSPPLSEVGVTFMKVSQNLFGETLLSTLGMQAGLQPCQPAATSATCRGRAVTAGRKVYETALTGFGSTSDAVHRQRRIGPVTLRLPDRRPAGAGPAADGARAAARGGLRRHAADHGPGRHAEPAHARHPRRGCRPREDGQHRQRPIALGLPDHRWTANGWCSRSWGTTTRRRAPRSTRWPNRPWSVWSASSAGEASAAGRRLAPDQRGHRRLGGRDDLRRRRVEPSALRQVGLAAALAAEMRDQTFDEGRRVQWRHPRFGRRRPAPAARR